MATQYTTEYSTVSADIQNIVANKVKLLDSYILFRTGDYEYTALIKDNTTGKTTEYTFSRSGANYSYVWEMSEASSEFDYTISNEYYVYSNVGVGRSLDLPVYDGVTAHATIIMCIVLMFAIIFKGALFKCLDRKRR